jgi:hypothetical protein
MTLRYVMLTVVVVAVALATGIVVHELSGSTRYRASCQFQLSLPYSTTQPGSDLLVYNRRQAADQLARAQLSDLFVTAARQAGVTPGEAAAAESIVQVSDGSFSLTATTADPRTAVKVANALCRAYVKQLTAQLSSEQLAEQNGIRAQITSLEQRLTGLVRRYGVHPAPSTAVDERATKDAIGRNQAYLAFALSQPPYDISVLSAAQGAGITSTKPSLSKSLIIAAAAGLLLSFLLILAVETVRKRPAVEV